MTPPPEDPGKSVFLLLLDTEPARRETEFDRLCAHDPALRRRVGTLLDAHHRSQTPLDAPPKWSWSSSATHASAAAPDDPRDPLDQHAEDAPVRPGDQLGPYTIESPLGSGAMGLVFAARHAGTGRLIALKLIRPDASSPAARRRFETEGRALARLRHPGIAQVHDAGVAHCRGQALPYLAMELVQGRPITDAARDLPRADRLRLIERVCRAVHHAHLNGVVHRDLKPANILLEAQGDPKVLDFGVAKLTESDAPGVTTHAGQLIGTPAYMSPEQLGADPHGVDHRADVYALGALLFETLTGRRPIDTGSAADLWAVLRRVEQGPPPLTSLDRTCRGDLDVITAVALRQDPAERYQSAAELADDLARHLARQPIRARPRTRRYVAGRFVKRNPLPIALGAAAALAVMAGTAGVVVKEREARAAEARAVERFNETRALARTVLFELEDAVSTLPGSTRARVLLAETAQDYLDRLAADPAADESLRIDVAEGYLKIGDILGRSYGPNLCDIEGAQRNWEKARAIIEPIASHQEASPYARAIFGRVLQSLQSVRSERAGHPEDKGVTQASRMIIEDAAGQDPTDHRIANWHVEAVYRHAASITVLEGSAGALPMFAESLALAESYAQRWPDNHQARTAVADAAFWLGYHTNRTAGADPDDTSDLFDRVDAVSAAELAEQPTHMPARHRQARIHGERALIAARRGDAPAADRHIRAGIEIWTELVRTNPDDQFPFRGLSVATVFAGDAARTLADTDPNNRAAHLRTAFDLFREAHDLLEQRTARGWLWPWETHYDAELRARIAECERLLAEASRP